MGVDGNGCADFLKMLLHGLGIGAGHHQGCAFVMFRADRAEYICALATLVGGLARARAFGSPLIDLAVLLAHPCFILEPQFNRRVRGDVFQALRQYLREVFLKVSIVSGSCFG